MYVESIELPLKNFGDFPGNTNQFSGLLKSKD